MEMFVQMFDVVNSILFFNSKFESLIPKFNSKIKILDIALSLMSLLVFLWTMYFSALLCSNSVGFFAKSDKVFESCGQNKKDHICLNS